MPSRIVVDCSTGRTHTIALTPAEQSAYESLQTQEEARLERQEAQKQQRVADIAAVLQAFASAVPDPAAQEALARILEGP